MRSSRSNLFTTYNFTGGPKLARGTTFGSQNQSGGTDFGGGPKFLLQPTSVAVCSGVNEGVPLSKAWCATHEICESIHRIKEYYCFTG